MVISEGPQISNGIFFTLYIVSTCIWVWREGKNGHLHFLSKRTTHLRAQKSAKSIQNWTDWPMCAKQWPYRLKIQLNLDNARLVGISLNSSVCRLRGMFTCFELFRGKSSSKCLQNAIVKVSSLKGQITSDLITLNAFFSPCSSISELTQLLFVMQWKKMI